MNICSDILLPQISHYFSIQDQLQSPIAPMTDSRQYQLIPTPTDELLDEEIVSHAYYVQHANIKLSCSPTSDYLSIFNVSLQMANEFIFDDQNDNLSIYRHQNIAYKEYTSNVTNNYLTTTLKQTYDLITVNAKSFVIMEVLMVLNTLLYIFQSFAHSHILLLTLVSFYTANKRNARKKLSV